VNDDILEVGWSLHADACFDDKEPRFLAFFPTEADAIAVLRKVEKGSMVGEYIVLPCVWASDGFYSGRNGETIDELREQVIKAGEGT
jgi:hypothetical protein